MYIAFSLRINVKNSPRILKKKKKTFIIIFLGNCSGIPLETYQEFYLGFFSRSLSVIASEIRLKLLQEMKVENPPKILIKCTFRNFPNNSTLFFQISLRLLQGAFPAIYTRSSLEIP